MLKFNHVEDYIEILAGYEPGGASVLFNTSKYTFSLARYDVKIVESMANSTVWGSMALTDKQGELALKLVEKYRRQYANHGIDITPVIENPTWRMPLRQIDRTQRIWLDDDTIKIKFPFNQNWIDDCRKFAQQSQGRAKWDHDGKFWTLGLSEYNVNWVVAWGQTWEFEIDPELIDIFNKIVEVEKTSFEIKLIKTDTGFEITNAADSLINYINQNGGFGQDNLTRLVDLSSICQYSAFECALECGCSTALCVIGTSWGDTYLENSDENVNMVLDYADETGRYPIYIFNPNETKLDLSRFKPHEILKFDKNGKTSSQDYNIFNYKVIYAEKIPKGWTMPVTLFVSTVEMLYGTTRQEWLRLAEKTIFLGKNLANK